MRKAHMVGGGVKKDKLTENEYLIYTLAVLPELVFCHGFGILKNIYEGTFDEADLGNEQIPEWYQSKIRLETLSGEFFRDLLFVFYLVDDFEFICNRLFFLYKSTVLSGAKTNEHAVTVLWSPLSAGAENAVGV